jgi:hypothetical protein
MADMNVIKTRHGRSATGGGKVNNRVDQPFSGRMESTPSFRKKPDPCIGNESRGRKSGSSY